MATLGALLKLPLKDGVDIEAGFVPRYELEDKAQQVIDKAADQLTNVNCVVFATDDDRMGELIAWQAKRLLVEHLRDKQVQRVRLGAIVKGSVIKALASPSGLDEAKILAEVVREVVDNIVTVRFRRAAQQPVHETQAHEQELNDLFSIGACTEATAGKPAFVGRVQGAVLRFLLARAREVAAAQTLARIQAVVTVHGQQFCGTVYRAHDDRETTPLSGAHSVATRLQGCSLQSASPPTVWREPIAAPAATTASILAAAWGWHKVLPWDAMGSLQALYDGNWSSSLGADTEPEDPIVPLEVAHGHPPITPVDRALPPQQLKDVMNAVDHKVCDLVWQYFTLAQQGTLEVLRTRVDFELHNQSSARLRVRFEGLSCSNADPALEPLILEQSPTSLRQSAAALKASWQQLKDAKPVFRVTAAEVWSLGPDELVRVMEDQGFGRPSTYAGVLERLSSNGLVQFPINGGPLRLTPSGVATARLLEAAEPKLSRPRFSSLLGELADKIERGEIGPRDALTQLAPDLAPELDLEAIGPRIWNSLPELEKALDRPARLTPRGSIVSGSNLRVPPIGDTAL